MLEYGWRRTDLYWLCRWGFIEGADMIRVTAVHPDSIAAELGLREGTELLSVNGRELDDFLDWEFLTAEEELLLHVRQPDGEKIESDSERRLGEPLGVGLEPPRIRRCANRC